MFVLLLLVPGVLFATTCVCSSMFVTKCVDKIVIKPILIKAPKIRIFDKESTDSFNDLVVNCDAYYTLAFAYQKA